MVYRFLFMSMVRYIRAVDVTTAWDMYRACFGYASPEHVIVSTIPNHAVSNIGNAGYDEWTRTPYKRAESNSILRSMGYTTEYDPNRKMYYPAIAREVSRMVVTDYIGEFIQM